jgi:hypothetical protein
VIFNPLKTESQIQNQYPGIKKAIFSSSYSSNSVEKIPIDELKKIISTMNS